MKSILIILSWILIISCNRDKVEECELHPLAGARDPLFLSKQYPWMDSPCFNPNNGKEFIYRLGDGNLSNSTWDLVKMNFETKETEIIYSGYFGNHIQWGVNDVILLEVKDSIGINIYGVESDGNTVSSLTQGLFNRSPLWNHNSSKYLYTVDNVQPSKCFIVDYDSNDILQEFNMSSIVLGTWQDINENFLYGTTREGLNVGNTITGKDSLLFEAEDINDYKSNAILLDSITVFWTHMSGIYITDLVTNNTDLIRETCLTEYYRYPTYSKDLDLIVVEKVENIQTDINSATVNKFSTLVSMTVDAREEKPIFE